MNKYCTFYIVRHGQSEANVNHVFGADSSLTPKGKEQAQKRAQEFLGVRFDAAFSSNLARARQTAEIIALEHALEVKTTKALRERYWGEMEGSNVDTWTQELRDLVEKWNNTDYVVRGREKIVPRMESDEEVISRFITFLRETAVAYMGKTVLIAAHSNIMRTLLIHLGFGGVKELPHNSIANTGYYILASDGVDFDVVKTVGIEKKVA